MIRVPFKVGDPIWLYKLGSHPRPWIVRAVLGAHNVQVGPKDRSAPSECARNTDVYFRPAQRDDLLSRLWQDAEDADTLARRFHLNTEEES